MSKKYILPRENTWYCWHFNFEQMTIGFSRGEHEEPRKYYCLVYEEKDGSWGYANTALDKTFELGRQADIYKLWQQWQADIFEKGVLNVS